MRKPKVIASMKGGHFLTVICSVCTTSLYAAAGIDLNQSGIPSTAGIGRGRIASSSGGQRNVIVGDAPSGDTASGATASGATASFVIAAIAPAARLLRVGTEEFGGGAATNPEPAAAGGHQGFQCLAVMLRRGADHCAQAGDRIVGSVELQQTVREVELRAQMARLDRQNLPKALDRALDLSFKQMGDPEAMQGARMARSVGQGP